MTVVAVIEDDSTLLQGVVILLTGWGYEVVPAASYADLAPILAATGHPPDLLLSDLLLDGFPANPVSANPVSMDPLADFIRAIGFHGPVVVMTGVTDPGVSATIATRGWHPLLKPFRPEDLHDLLRRLIPGRSRAP